MNIELGLGSVYNDNILKYSDYYLDKFLNNEDEGRFHVNTSDGLVVDQSINISPAFLFFKKNKTILAGEFTRHSYVNNKIKTWSQIDFDIKQYIGGKFILNLSYSYIPEYYVRHYRDEDLVDLYGDTPDTFQPFEFAKNNYGVWVQKSFFRHSFTRLRLSFNHEEYLYNEFYSEYDCSNENYAIKFYQSIKDKIKFEFGYQFVVSDARGFDEIQENKENSDDSDPSYKADEFSGSIKYPLPRIFNKQHTISADVEYKRNCYSSEHFLEDDKLHAGRTDGVSKIGFIYEIKLSRPLAVSCFYKWCKQDSDTKAEENKELVSREKDYTQEQFGLKVTYNFREIKFSRSQTK